MTKKSTRQLVSDSFSSVRLPAGSFLFFPEWNAKEESTGEGLNSVVIQSAPTRRKRFQGAIVGSALFVVVDKTLFRKFAAMLRRRPIAEKPLTFAFELDERNALIELKVDGRDFCDAGPSRPHVPGLKSDKTKPCE